VLAQGASRARLRDRPAPRHGARLLAPHSHPAVPRRLRVTRALVTRALLPFQQFVEAGSMSGILLIACTLAALAWANSPWQAGYHHLLDTRFVIGVPAHPLNLTLHHWINDGLMSVFFLLVGLEIKRELIDGELSSVRQATLPISAALGGMLFPALLYLAVNSSGESAAGWGIPMATDIAFALGILTLLGPRVPLGLKIFLTALAIVDDMGAVLVIALFYTNAIDVTMLTVAVATLAALVVLNVTGVRMLLPYLVLGLVLWLSTLASGIHSTIAGVALALTIPTRAHVDARQFSSRARRILDAFDTSTSGRSVALSDEAQRGAITALESVAIAVQAPLLRLERSLHGVVAFFIMPVFALANAGVPLDDVGTMIGEGTSLGIALGLLVGKPLGISLFSWLSVRLRLTDLPAGVGWTAIIGASCLGGIGFTMSLFIAGLAFGESPLVDVAKVGVLGASTIAGLAGYTILRRSMRARARRHARA
jgi:Na+:H+ antiporter, NhaA family